MIPEVSIPIITHKTIIPTLKESPEDGLVVLCAADGGNDAVRRRRLILSRAFRCQFPIAPL